MMILGIETSCDETGVAVYHKQRGLLAHAVHSQVEMHDAYGGVVPELASRDHIRRLVPLLQQVLAEAGVARNELDAIAYTAGPGLAGALLVGASFATGLASALGLPAIPVHHLEGHLLSPLLSSEPIEFPFIALLVSGGHTQIISVARVGDYELLGESLDDAVGEAIDKTAQLLGLGYPGGPALSQLAKNGRAGRFDLPRPMLNSGDLNFSFSGLKTAVLTRVRAAEMRAEDKADLAAEFQEAFTEVLVSKALNACRQRRLKTLVVAGGVGANQRLRQRFSQATQATGISVYYPDWQLCTDNGAMIAFAGAQHLSEWAQTSAPGDSQAPMTGSFVIRPRWNLAEPV